MTNHYEVLGVERDSSLREVKRAFRERAKQLHPDITGVAASPEMRRLLDAYEVLSNRERRSQYDRVVHNGRSFYRSTHATFREEFDYRDFLKKKINEEPEKEQPQQKQRKARNEQQEAADYYRAKLIFFDLLNFEEEDAVAVWQAAGGVQFPLDQFLDREDWMDCGFLLAEELERNDFVYEAFLLAAQLLTEERKKPYFRHFALDVEIFLKELIRNRLRRYVPDKTWIGCLKTLLELGFSAREEARWLVSLAMAFHKTGNNESAKNAVLEAKKRDPKITIPRKLETS